MDARHPIRRALVLLALCLGVVGVSGCGFVLREDAIPEQLPTTTQPPSAFPDPIAPPVDPAAGSAESFLFEEQAPGAVPGSTAPPVVPKEPLLVEAELDGLVSADAPAVCRSGAAASYFLADAVAAGLDLETGEVFTAPDEPRIRTGMERAADELEAVIPQLEEQGIQLTTAARLDAAIADLRGTAQVAVSDVPLVLELRRWWNRHGETLRGVVGGLGAVCTGEPFTEYLGGWQ